MSMIYPDDMKSSIAQHEYHREVHFQTLALGQLCKWMPILKQSTDLNINILFNDYA